MPTAPPGSARREELPANKINCYDRWRAGIAVGELLKRQLDDTDRAGLLRVGAGLSSLLAIDLSNAGNQRAARISWNSAVSSADASGDRDLRVWVRGQAAQDAVGAEQPSAVITDLTNDAIDIAGGKPSPGLARAHAARAYIAADQGDTSQAHEALAALKRTFDQLPDDTNRSDPLPFRARNVRWAESYVYTQSGEAWAEATVSQALTLYPSYAVGPIACLSLMRANLMIKDREVDAGLETALSALESQRFSTLVVASGTCLLARQVLRTLPDQARALPAARELHALTTGARYAPNCPPEASS